MNNISVCPNCGATRSFKVINTRVSGPDNVFDKDKLYPYIRRRKECLNCKYRIATYEISAEDFKKLKELGDE